MKLKKKTSKSIKSQINNNQKEAKIDKITNWMTQLFFERLGVNFQEMREKRENKEKKFIAAQPNLLRKHASHRQIEYDSPLPMMHKSMIWITEKNLTHHLNGTKIITCVARVSNLFLSCQIKPCCKFQIWISTRIHNNKGL